MYQSVLFTESSQRIIRRKTLFGAKQKNTDLRQDIDQVKRHTHGLGADRIFETNHIRLRIHRANWFAPALWKS